MRKVSSNVVVFINFVHTKLVWAQDAQVCIDLFGKISNGTV